MTDNPQKRSPTPEERIAKLEQNRYRMFGIVNALNVIIADLVCEQYLFAEEYPDEALKQLRKNWLLAPQMATKGARSTDPAESDLIEQEFRDAVDLLTNTTAGRLQFHRPRKKPDPDPGEH